MLPSPMLSRSGELPAGAGWAFEVKWDGFRALVSTENGLRVRSRRGWNMTALVPELDDLPAGLVLDGELVSFNDDGDPHFSLVSRRILHGDRGIPVRMMIFDVLAIDGEPLLHQPLANRRERLEALTLEGPAWSTPDTFNDGHALYAAVCERGLEGVVAKPLRSSYRPGQRGWIKVKNPYWRRESEIGAMQFSRRRLEPSRRRY
jgi:bifunctional non-homologous end joining protein LigD